MGALSREKQLEFLTNNRKILILSKKLQKVLKANSGIVKNPRIEHQNNKLLNAVDQALKYLVFYESEKAEKDFNLLNNIEKY